MGGKLLFPKRSFPPMLNIHLKNSKLGWLSVLLSAICLFLATAVVRHASKSVDLPVSLFIVARFSVGFFITGLIFSYRRRLPQVFEWRFLITRVFCNACAVYCFYRAIELTTLAQANILNLTYPIYVALYSAVFDRGRRDWMGYLFCWNIIYRDASCGKSRCGGCGCGSFMGCGLWCVCCSFYYIS